MITEEGRVAQGLVGGGNHGMESAAYEKVLAH